MEKYKTFKLPVDMINSDMYKVAFICNKYINPNTNTINIPFDTTARIQRLFLKHCRFTLFALQTYMQHELDECGLTVDRIDLLMCKYKKDIIDNIPFYNPHFSVNGHVIR